MKKVLFSTLVLAIMGSTVSALAMDDGETSSKMGAHKSASEQSSSGEAVRLDERADVFSSDEFLSNDLFTVDNLSEDDFSDIDRDNPDLRIRKSGLHEGCRQNSMESSIGGVALSIGSSLPYRSNESCEWFSLSLPNLPSSFSLLSSISSPIPIHKGREYKESDYSVPYLTHDQVESLRCESLQASGWLSSSSEGEVTLNSSLRDVVDPTRNFRPILNEDTEISSDSDSGS